MGARPCGPALFYCRKNADMTLKQTPLNAAHRAMGAKMVDFGGWDMPVNYGSQIEEHHQVRNDCGMFDVCHMRVVDAKGDGVRAFLRYLLANNADKLTLPGKALYSAMLRPEGGVIDDLIIYFMSEQWFRIVVNAGTADKDIAWMKQQAAAHAPQLTITSRDDLAMVAIQGPNARAKVWEVLPEIKSRTETLIPFQAADIQPETITTWINPSTGKAFQSDLAQSLIYSG